MSQPSHPPRDLQLDELTRGVNKFPLAALTSRHLKFIADFLVQAWEELLATYGLLMYMQEEKGINALMETRLLTLLDKDRAWSTLVAGVARGRESTSHNGGSLEKRPDLSVYLTKKDRHFPLIIECKLLDKKAGKEVALYGYKGLARFLDGEYAWYACEAFMLAYVRDDSTIRDCLTTHLAERQKRAPDPFLTVQLPQIVKLPSQDLAKSRHGRRFQNRFQDNPGPIDIWHLWLS